VDATFCTHTARQTHTADLARWRRSRTPALDAWWWQPLAADRAWPARLERALTVILLLVSL
jgi:hypothetical protein